MDKVQAALRVVLGASCAVAAGAVVTYAAVCYAGVFDGASLDVELPQHRPSLLSSHPLLNNALLLFIFLGSHSLLARRWVKKVLSPILPPSLYRQFFFITSTVFLFLIPYGWSPMPHLLWHVDTLTLRYTLYSVTVCGMVLATVAFFTVNPLEFCGIQDSIHTLIGTSTQQGKDSELVVHGVYGMVRHPMYTGVLMMLWSQTVMTQGRLLLAAAMSLYLFLAVSYLEEPDLLQLFDDQYRDYMKTTGMFFPWLLPLGKNKERHE